MNLSPVKHQTVMVNNITSHSNMNPFSAKSEIGNVNNITNQWLVILFTIPVLCLTEEWFIFFWLDIMLTITVICLTDEWFILLWLLILLTYCLRFDREVVHIVATSLSNRKQ
jgi:hypothetical protein